METGENKSQKSKLQIIGASFVMITGLFVMLAMANNVTGAVTGTSSRVSISSVSIALWGLLILGVGVWIMRKRDFGKSIFD